MASDNQIIPEPNNVRQDMVTDRRIRIQGDIEENDFCTYSFWIYFTELVEREHFYKQM